MILSYYYHAPVVFWWHLGFSIYSIMLSANSDSFINESYKVTGHKINIQKSVAFLYMNNEILTREIKETIHLPTIKSNQIPRNKSI